MQNSRVSLGLGLLLAAALGFVVGCKPDYPACEADTDCKEKEFCVDRKCQQCRASSDCQEGYACTSGKCSAIPGYCRDKSQCPAGQECIGNRCRPCEGDNECAAGLKCVQGACVKPQCSKDDDCAQDQECQNGFCVAARPKNAGGPPCALDAVYFGFNESTLNSEATSALTKNAECLKKAPDRSINLLGRADPRGTPEYNLALSDKRSQAVKKHLERLGVKGSRLISVPRGELDAQGTDDASWARDRRVDSEWQ